MPNLATVLRSELRRLSRREVRKALSRVKAAHKQLTALRGLVRGQAKTLAAVERRLARLKGGVAARRRRVRGVGVAGAGRTVEAVRRRLELSRAQLAKRIGVSSWTIFGWETGRTRPTPENLGRVQALVSPRRLKTRRVRRAA
jgi:hypothetical protein